METPVQIAPSPAKRRAYQGVESNVAKITFAEAFASCDSDQVCRTCKRSSNRYWQYPPAAKIDALKAGNKMSDLACAVDREALAYRVTDSVSRNDQIVSLGAPAPKRTWKEADDAPPKTIIAHDVAIVSSCGQEILGKCRNCDRFEPLTVSVPYARYGGRVAWHVVSQNGRSKLEPYSPEGGSLGWRKVTIGGRCTIPREGIVVKGVRKTCDPVPRRTKVDNPSCANCYYLTYPTGEAWQHDYLWVNENGALTPYERERAAEKISDEVSPAMAYGIALYQKQTKGSGRHMWFRAQLMRSGRRKGMQAYELRFSNNIIAIVAEGDDRYVVHGAPADYVYIPDGPKIHVAVDILWPHHKAFRLAVPNRYYPLVWPALPEKIKARTDTSHLVNSDCPRCRKDRACYFHAKDPVREVDGTITFDHPAGERTVWIEPPQGMLKVINDRGRVHVVDGNGNEPETYGTEVANVSVMRKWLPTLLEAAAAYPDGPAQIRQQYVDMVKGLRRGTRYRTIRPSWLVNSGQEPSKPYCSHPSGLNLRKVMNDAFGSERTDLDYDLGAANQMAIEEELRVGFRQHSQTPQRLHEEILANDAMHPNFDQSAQYVVPRNVEMPSEWVTVRIEGIGGMTDESGSPVTNTREFLDRLDDEVVLGERGTAMRKVTKRNQLFGYDLSRGYFGKRKGSDKTSVASSDTEAYIFETSEETDQVDLTDAWRCPDCAREYDSSEITDFWYPVCEDCGSDLYRNHQSRDTIYTRMRGGVGVAMVRDSESMLQRRRLWECVCPQWRLRADRVITLSDVWGEDSTAAMDLLHSKSVDGPTVVKVHHLSEAQQQVNMEWAEAMAAVEAQRSDYLNAHPGTPVERLKEMFPTPSGTRYEEIAHGSAAKLGSVAVFEQEGQK